MLSVRNKNEKQLGDIFYKVTTEWFNNTSDYICYNNLSKKKIVIIDARI